MFILVIAKDLIWYLYEVLGYYESLDEPSMSRLLFPFPLYTRQMNTFSLGPFDNYPMFLGTQESSLHTETRSYQS